MEGRLSSLMKYKVERIPGSFHLTLHSNIWKLQQLLHPRTMKSRQTARRSSGFPPASVADPGITAQKTNRKSSQNDNETQSGSAQVRSTPGTTSNASATEPKDGKFNMVRLSKQILKQQTSKSLMRTVNNLHVLGRSADSMTTWEPRYNH